MSIIFNFLKKYYKIILFLLIVGIVSYVSLCYISIPFYDNQYNKKIDSLNNVIDRVEKEQIRLDTNISHYNQEMVKVDNNIEKIKSEKTIINNIYHEKINDVNNYTNDELDSFFTVRYGYIPPQTSCTKQ